LLKEPDFTTAFRIEEAIEKTLGSTVAEVRDPGLVEVLVTGPWKDRVVGLVATLESLEASPDVPARVIVDERTGTVVAGASITLGIGDEDVRFGGFPDWYDELVPVRVVAGVRYRTTGAATDDFYRVEASVDGSFRPPVGHSYTPFAWNFFTPIVGAGGPNQPSDDPDYPSAKLLVRPNVPSYRTATATLTKNPEPSADGTGYAWPPLTRAELATTEIRIASAPVARTAGDNFQIVVDALWLDVYGVESRARRRSTACAWRKRRRADWTSRSRSCRPPSSTTCTSAR
ncbi:MAG: flagellar basal body P-ring protein FlgI, partial [Acidobacteria bacterium]|nr:flagellar basal body P-ring protein FlgI [Acidobacteriota bacterium]